MEHSRFIVHRGLFGLNLKSQCIGIGGGYIVLSFAAIFTASLMLHHPMTFVNLEQIKTHQTHQTLLPPPSLINSSENNIDNDENKDKNDAMEIIIDDVKTATDEIEEITRKLVKSVGTDAVEWLVFGFATFVVSVLLIYGIKTSKTSFILPWIIETIVQTSGTFIIFLVKIATPGAISVVKAFCIVIYFSLAIYFVLCVYSYYTILKIQKRSVVRFLEHEFEANDGGFYRPFDMNTRPGPQKPWKERTVPMNSHEDIDREHVLYARMS